MTIRAIISRAEAKAQGLGRYFTGIPCKYGHVCERLVSVARCLECHRAKNLARQKTDAGRAYKKKWGIDNQEQESIRSRDWREANRERHAANNKAWREANPERGKGYCKKHYDANPELRRECTKTWQRANPDAVRAISRARRARKRGAEGFHTQEDITKLLDQQNKECLCGVSFDLIDYTVDHIVPLSRGGSNWPDNLQLLCQSCNDSKGTKLVCEWVVPNRRVAA